MTCVKFRMQRGIPLVVGSLGDRVELHRITPADCGRTCDVVEIRLDLLAGEDGHVDPADWRHLAGTPLLFTARRHEEGGAAGLDAAARATLLEAALDDAALVDIEVASIPEMRGLIATLAEKKIPWIASYHDFNRLPDNAALVHAAKLALKAGAAGFKAAAKLNSPADLARLAEFQTVDHGLLVSTMGMGPLAPVSRLLAAQCGSVLNYGYLAGQPTAPGQWDCALLKTTIARLQPFKA